MVNKYLQQLASACFPQRCLYCQLPSHEPLPLCAGCHAELPFNTRPCRRCALPLPPGSAAAVCGACLANPPPWDTALAPLLYDEQVALMIQRWKYRPAPALGELAVSLWLEGSPARLPPVDRVVPVPLHWRRFWQRGFNQARQLSEGIRRRHRALVTASDGSALVRRTRHTPTQAGLAAGQRAGNLRGAFTIRKPCDNLRIALVDDVVTTGATARALASALHNAGAGEIHLWCLARTPAS